MTKSREMLIEWMNKKDRPGVAAKALRNIDMAPDPTRCFEESVIIALHDALGEMKTGILLNRIVCGGSGQTEVMKAVEAYHEEICPLAEIYVQLVKERRERKKGN